MTDNKFKLNKPKLQCQPDKDLSVLMDTTNNHDGKTKRKTLSTPPTENSNKRYLLDPDSLIKKNKFHALSIEVVEQKSSDTTANKTRKIPPIFLHEANNYLKAIKDIKELNIQDFTTTNLGDVIKINTTNSDDYRKLTKFYEDNNLRFHTYHNPENANLSIIIRNIPISVDEKEIQNELSRTFPIIKVTRLFNKNKFPIPICAVLLNSTDKSKEIFKVTHLFHCCVQIEPRRKTADIPQCTRCQRFGHTRNYCKLDPRCVKCKNSHLYSECTKTPAEKPQCVNCGADHPANFRGCQYYLEQKAKLRPHQTTNTQSVSATPFTSNVRQSNNAQLTTDRTYASVVNNNNNHTQQPAHTNPQSDIIEILKDTLTNWIKPVLDQIKHLITQLITNLFNNGSK